jgi:energy-coupling factor transport system permease protein
LLFRLDPRAKGAVLLCVSLLLFARDSFPGLIAGSVLVIAGFFGSRIGARDILKRLRSVSWFALVIIAMNAWTVGGRVLFTFAGWYCTLEGVAAGVLLAFRLALLAAASLLFVRSTPVPAMADAVESAFGRFDATFRGATMSLLLALMFGPMLVDRSRQLTRAYLARGADVNSGLPARIRFAAAAAIPLFVSAFRSSDQLAIAMQTRCYDPRQRRTPFRVARAEPVDIAAAGIVIAVTLIILLWPGHGA